MLSRFPFINSKRSGFTLIELLVVIAIIAILAVVVVLVLNPAQLLAQSRDSNRVSDLSSLNSAIGIYQEDVSGRSIGTSSLVYVSIPSSQGNCSDLGLPSLPTSSRYSCASSADYRSAKGTGWIPVDFQSISQGSPLGSLPVDPLNQTSTGLYYTYMANGNSYELTAAMESEKYRQVCANENGKYSDLCMEGTDLALAPIDFNASSSLAQPTSSNLVSFNTPIIMSTAVAGQTSTTVAFSANANQTISIAFTSSTYRESQFISLLNSNGTAIAQAWFDQNGGNAISHFTLPSAGIYTLELSTRNQDLGQVTAEIYAYTDLTGTIAANTPTAMSNTYPGQYDLLAFNGTASSTISVSFTNSSYRESEWINFINPSGTVAWSGWYDGNGGNPLSNYALPSTGLYTIEITPRNQDTGQVNAHLSMYSDLTGTIAADTPTVMSTTYPGQTYSLSFSAAANQKISVTFTNTSYPESEWVNLYNSAGTAVWSGWYDGNGGDPISNFTIPSTDTYTLTIFPRNQDTGHVTAELYPFTDATGTIAADTPTIMSNTYPGQTDSLSFSGTANQKISVTFTGTSYPESEFVYLFNSNGTVVWSGWYDGNGGNPISNFTLPSTDTYTLEITPRNQDTGHVTAELYPFTNATGTIAADTPTVMSTTYPGQTYSLSFSASANQKISVTFNNSTYPESEWINLYNSAGTAIWSGWYDQNGGDPISNFTLPSTDTYTLTIFPRNQDTGHVTAELYPYTDLTGTIAANTPTTMSNTYPGQTYSLNFSAAANQRISITFTGTSYPESEWVNLYNSAGTAVWSGWYDQNGGNPISNFNIPTADTYTFTIFPRNQDTGHVTAELYPFTDATGTIAANTPTIMSNTYPGQTDSLSFSATASQKISVSFSGATYPESQWVALFNSGGSVVWSGWYDQNGGTPISNLTLSATDTYTLTIFPRNRDTGQVTADLTGL